MQRIIDATATASLPPPPALVGTTGYFTEGSPGVAAATKVRGWWVNMVQEELMALLTAAGVTPDTTAAVFNQVLAAVKILGGVGSALAGAALRAAMSVTAASATATFTADEVIVQTALGGGSFCLANFSETINLGTTGANGMDTGTAPVSGFVAVYAIYNPTTNTAALLGVNATAAAAPSIYGGAHMPSGYTASGLVSVWPTNGSSQFAIGYQRGRKVNIAASGILSTTTPVGVTALSVSSVAPLNAIRLYGNFNGLTSGATGNWTLAVFATAGSLGECICGFGIVNGGGSSDPFVVDISTPQEIYYSLAGSGGTPTATASAAAYEF